MLQLRPRLLGKLSVAVHAPLVSRSPGDKQRDKNHVERNDGAPEMDFPQRFVQHAAKHFGIPEREARVDGDDGDRNERVVKVRDDEIRVVQIDVGAGGTEENSRHAADEELSYESE